MERKNGFTLIELLAIIVILAIIAVITVPIILGIIDDASKNAAVDSAYGYRDAVNKFYAQSLIDNDNLKLNDTYVVTNGVLSDGNFGDETVTSFPIQVSGTVPSSGLLTYQNNELISGCLVIGDYAVTFNSDHTISVKKGGCLFFGYSIAQNGYDSNDSSTLSMIRPTSKNAYLKYILTNKTVTPGMPTFACVYNEGHGGELCLSNNSYGSSTQSIMSYFGYDSNTWTNISGNIWKDSSQTITCNFDSFVFACSDSYVLAEAYPGGSVDVRDYPTNFYCSVSTNGTAGCHS